MSSLLPAGQVVDRERVVAANRGDADVLDPGQIHRDRADITCQPRMRAVGRQPELLRGAEPLNAIASRPSPPPTTSLPSPGFQTTRSSPAPS